LARRAHKISKNFFKDVRKSSVSSRKAMESATGAPVSSHATFKGAVQALKLWAALLSLTLLSILAFSSIQKISLSDRQAMRRRLFQGGVIACLSLMFEMVSGGMVFKFFGLKLAQISYFNQGITLMVLFFPLFFYRPYDKWIPLTLYGGLLLSSFFFDYDAGVLALLLMPVFFGLFSFSPYRIIKVMTGCSVAVILLGPLMTKYVLNYDLWQTHFSQAQDPSWLNRLRIWSYAANKSAQKPFLGWGLNSSRHATFHEVDIWHVKNPSNPRINHTYRTPSISLHPHNVTLQIWLELGAMGALIFAAVVASLGRVLRGAYLSHPLRRVLATIFAITFVFAHLSYGFWQSWWFAGLGFVFIWGALIQKDEST
jgi:O-antigen ligase